MRRVRTVVARSEGKLQFIPRRELWAVSGVLADTFPLDRDLARAPRWARRASHWTRLVLVDRALTDRDRTALLTLSDTPWVPAVLVAVLAAAVAPRLPRWLRVALFGGAVGVGRPRPAGVAVRRHAARAAAGGAERPRSSPTSWRSSRVPGMRWVADALDTVGDEIPFVALRPGVGRRTTRCGARAALRASAGVPPRERGRRRRAGRHDPRAPLTPRTSRRQRTASNDWHVSSATRSRSPHWPALDGWRGFTIWFAISVHAGYFTGGGVLSLDTFFALSGFLITGLLLREWQRHEGIDLLAFWARRARRLLPALFVVLAAVVVYAAFVASPLGLDTLRGDVLATLGYSANWRFVLSGQSYFSSFTTPSPVLHMWSLAVEEQFYLVWPLVVLGVLCAGPPTALDHRRDRRGRRRRRGRRDRVGDHDGVALHARRRRVARVLRHRHPRAGDARRRGARGRGAPARTRADARRQRGLCRSARRSRSSSSSRRGSRATRARCTTSSTGASGCSRTPCAACGGAVAPHAAVGGLVRARPRDGAAALGRRDLVRDVPVALADLPVPHRAAHVARRRLAASRCGSRSSSGCRG